MTCFYDSLFKGSDARKEKERERGEGQSCVNGARGERKERREDIASPPPPPPPPPVTCSVLPFPLRPLSKAEF